MNVGLSQLGYLFLATYLNRTALTASKRLGKRPMRVNNDIKDILIDGTNSESKESIRLSFMLDDFQKEIKKHHGLNELIVKKLASIKGITDEEVIDKKFIQ